MRYKSREHDRLHAQRARRAITRVPTLKYDHENHTNESSLDVQM